MKGTPSGLQGHSPHGNLSSVVVGALEVISPLILSRFRDTTASNAFSRPGKR
eukprot:m.20414 g.20414  ORF g.20414 m.20414 type:complete len:52 (-) comp5566_c0_seq1:64-219(-)